MRLGESGTPSLILLSCGAVMGGCEASPGQAQAPRARRPGGPGGDAAGRGYAMSFDRPYDGDGAVRFLAFDDGFSTFSDSAYYTVAGEIGRAPCRGKVESS